MRILTTRKVMVPRDDADRSYSHICTVISVCDVCYDVCTYTYIQTYLLCIFVCCMYAYICISKRQVNSSLSCPCSSLPIEKREYTERIYMCSDGRMDVKFPALIRNYGRQTNQPTDRPTNHQTADGQTEP